MSDNVESIVIEKQANNDAYGVMYAPMGIAPGQDLKIENALNNLDSAFE